MVDNNNINQNNQVSSTPVDATSTPNVTMPNPTPTYDQFAAQVPTTPVATPAANAPKKSGPIIIFGIFALVAIVLIATIFIENKKGTDVEKGIINEDTKTLIVFFSHDGENYGKNLNIENKVTLTVGNTEAMAKKIQSFIDADTVDIYEIEPETPYPTDLNELYGYTKIEYNRDTYPKIKNKINNLDEYDVVFIGYPIWHASYPQIIKSFVNDNRDILKNKVIVPFNTHAGSGSAGTYKMLYSLIGVSEEKGLNGLAINGTEVATSDSNIKKWLEGLGYKIK